MIGGAEGDRTPDLMTASHALSQLSYGPKESKSNVPLQKRSSERIFNCPIGDRRLTILTAAELILLVAFGKSIGYGV